jgi:hypothetical protein
MQNRKKSLFLAVIAIVILLLAGIPVASAFTATLISPTDINNVYPGDTVNIKIEGLAIGNTFKTQMISTDLVTSGGTVTFSNFVMPFSLTSGTATVNLTTTTASAGKTTLTVTEGSTPYSKDSTVDSITSINTIRDITARTYDITISNTVVSSGSTVGINYAANGSVAAGPPSPAYLNFTITGVNTGHLQILVNDGSSNVMDHTLTIVARPVDDGGGGGGDDTPPGYIAPITPQAAALTGGPVIKTNEITFQQNEEGRVLAIYNLESDPAAGFSSKVIVTTGTKILSGTGEIVTGISVTPIDVAAVPSSEGGVYSFSGFSLECKPSGTTFSQPVTLVFSLTPAQWAEALSKAGGDPNAMTIQFYDAAAGIWIAVPTTVDSITHQVSASITHFSIYALFFKNSNIVAASPETSITPSTTYAVPVANTPVGTPIPNPTKSPMVPGILIIGVIGLVGYFIAHKKM